MDFLKLRKTVKNQKLMLSKTRAFSLIETLVGLLIFAIVLLANGKALNTFLKLQTESNIQLIVIDVMQSRLQKAVVSATADPCDGVTLDEFAIHGTTYYIACVVETINKNGAIAKWPVLAVGNTESHAQSCAAGTETASCYVVGR